MKHQTLVYGSIIAVGIIAAVICVGMVSGYSVFKPFISVDPVSDKNVGDQFTITGTTSLPAGTEILAEVYPASYEDNTGTGSGEFSGATGTITIAGGTGGSNTWTFELDTSTFQPVEYLVTMSSFKDDHAKGDYTKGDIFGTARFTVHPASGTAVTAGSTHPSDNAAPGGILIDPIRDTTSGDLLVVTGKTNLSAGTYLIVKVIPTSMDNVRITGDYRNPENAAVTKVVQDSGLNNRFSVALDTRFLPPAEYIILVSEMKDKSAGMNSEPGRWTGSALFNIIAPTTGTSLPQNDISVPAIFINPVGDLTGGDSFIVSGTTNRPAGTEFKIFVIPESSTDYKHPELAATAPVVKGSGTGNLFSVTLAAEKLTKGEHIVFVSDEKGNVTGTILFTVKG